MTVTSTGLDSFPPQSVATTDTTCRPDSARDSGAVVEITPVWLTLRETTGIVKTGIEDGGTVCSQHRTFERIQVDPRGARVS